LGSWDGGVIEIPWAVYVTGWLGLRWLLPVTFSAGAPYLPYARLQVGKAQVRYLRYVPRQYLVFLDSHQRRLRLGCVKGYLGCLLAKSQLLLAILCPMNLRPLCHCHSSSPLCTLLERLPARLTVGKRGLHLSLRKRTRSRLCIAQCRPQGSVP